MRTCLFLFIPIGLLMLEGCKPKCCSEPKGFHLNITYVSKDGVNLCAYYIENKQIVNRDGRYDTRKIEVYKVINNDHVVTKEPLDSWVKKREAYGDIGHSALSLTLPTEDKRVSKILIYLHPSQELDTISYTGEGPYNFPETKNIFYNRTCIENLSIKDGGGNSELRYYYITVTKPD